MKYNFDEIINRQGMNAMSTNGFRAYLFTEDDELNFPCADDEFISMWIADMDFATPPEIIDSLKQRLNGKIFGYTNAVNPAYISSFQEWTKTKYDWEFDADHMVTSPGVIPALYDLVGYICKPDEKVLIMTPSYAFFQHAADYNQIEFVTSDLVCDDGHYTMDFEDIRKKTEDEKVVLCIFCSPHNPTGRVWTKQELQQLGEICLENKVKIIADEIHCDILRKEKTFIPLANLFSNSPEIITCMAPSKTFNMAGFQLANIIIHDNELRAEWNRQHLPVVNPLSMVAAQAAYTHGHQWLEELTIYLDNNFIFLKNFLSENLPNSIFNISESTYLAWVDISYYLPDEENLTLFFANHAGVLLEGGNMFVANSDGYIRLNLACPLSKLKEGLNKITKAIIEVEQKNIV